MKRLLLGAVLAVVVGLSACSGDKAPPGAPPPVVNLVQSLITLTGTVSSQAGAKLTGAAVTIVDGVNKGRGTTTDAAGNYTIGDVTPVGGTVQAIAAGFEPKNAGFSNVSGSFNFVLRTSVPFTISGIGDTVFNIPSFLTTVRVTGTYTGGSSNFIMNCGNFSGFLVNELLGTFWGPTTYSGTLLTRGCSQTAVTNSSGVSWSVTEVR